MLAPYVMLGQNSRLLPTADACLPVARLARAYTVPVPKYTHEVRCARSLRVEAVLLVLLD
eukprot:3060762-Amphidinium_carterae.1